jgi:glycosyltransferase involved in cell wall biosynthesis
MHILIVNNSFLPAIKYGGTERMIWWLGKALVNSGHKVSYLVKKGSYCPFASVYEYNNSIPFNKQIPSNVDVVHLNHAVNEQPNIPYLITIHWNSNDQQLQDINSVFVSGNHASRYGSKCFVHNGLDPADYGTPSLDNKRSYVHFLGDAAWRVKNVSGAIKIAAKAAIPLHVIGGFRFNINQGIRLTFNTNTRFMGLLGGDEKFKQLSDSAALLFPIRWHEPFGIAIIESLYFGCPVFGTPYGSLPEIVTKKVGFLSNKTEELAKALQNIGDFNRKDCHQHVSENYTSEKMAASYVLLYEKVLNNHGLNGIAPKLISVQQEKFLPFY